MSSDPALASPCSRRLSPAEPPARGWPRASVRSPFTPLASADLATSANRFTLGLLAGLLGCGWTLPLRAADTPPPAHPPQAPAGSQASAGKAGEGQAGPGSGTAQAKAAAGAQEAGPKDAVPGKEAPPPIADADRGRDPRDLVAEGLAWYGQQKFEDARKKFAAADVAQPEDATIAFDLACAYHRKGDRERALEYYQKAGLARQPALACAALFNSGMLEADVARGLAGADPARIAPEKREELTAALLRAVALFRQCIERDPGQRQARHNLELIRQWIRYYSELWRKQDRDQRRQELDLAKFLEYLIQAQEALQAAAERLQDLDPPPANPFYALKQQQEELAAEIPTLKEKIAALGKQAAQPPPPGAPHGHPAPPAPPGAPPGADLSAEQKAELEKALKQFQAWADEAGGQMTEAVVKLDQRQAKPAREAQAKAVQGLEQIWEQVVPFGPLLQKALGNQTVIAQGLQSGQPPAGGPSAPGAPGPAGPSAQPPGGGTSGGAAQGPAGAASGAGASAAPGGTGAPADQDGAGKEVGAGVAAQVALQKRTLRHTGLLVPKAQATLEQLASQPQGPAPGGPSPQAPHPHGAPGHPPGAAPGQAQDQEQLKKALQKALELAPQAAAREQQALQSLEADQRTVAYGHAEAARKLLEEIANEMPKDQNQQQQDQKDQQKQDQPKKDEQKEDPKKQDPQKEKEKKPQEQQPPRELSESQAEALLRRVREREQEKRRRQDQMRALMGGDSGEVDRDW